MAYDNQPICPPTPQKKPKRTIAPRKIRANIVVDYIGKISPEDPNRIVFGKEHDNPDLSGKVIQIENTDMTIHIYDLSKDALNIFVYAAESRRNCEVIFNDCILNTSNINPFYRGELLCGRFKSFTIKNSDGEYINFSSRIANDVPAPTNAENKEAKRLKRMDESQAASSAQLEWRNRSVPISLMFTSQHENPNSDDDKFKVPAPVKRLYK